MIPLAAGLSIAVGLAVGVLGALHVVHEHLRQSLRAGASSASPAHHRLRGALVVGQVALSTTLLAGAVLLVRVVLDLERVDVGFDPRAPYSVSFGDRDFSTVRSSQELAALGSALRDMGERQLGMRNLTIATAVTPDQLAFPSAFESHDRPGVVGAEGVTSYSFVAPDFFSVMRVPLLAGRGFDAGSHARDEVVVSRTLARHLGYDGNVARIVGRRFRFRVKRPGRVEPWQTVVGVAPDVLANRLDRAAQPMLLKPHPPPAGNAMSTALIVRLPRADAWAVLRRFARTASAGQWQWNVRSVEARVDRAMAEPRFTMSVLVAFTMSTVLLAAIGLFGVLSYSLGLRTREIGVRIALGATRRSIVGSCVRDAMGQAALGTAIGLAGAAGIARLTQTSFYGVERIDAHTFLLAATSMLLASLVACVGPLFRATRVDPAVAVRAE